MGLKYTPTSIATLIYNISPILVAVIVPFILNEVLTKIKVFSVFGSFVGASLFIIHKNVLPGDVDHYYLGILLIFFTWLTAVVLIILARIVKNSIHFWICPIYFGGSTLCLSFLLLIIAPSVFNFEHYNTFDWSLFLISGMFNFFGSTFRFISFQYEDLFLKELKYYKH